MLRQISIPRYQTLAENLRQSVKRGEYKPGDRLPSESQLCVTHGVSRGTVVRAIEMLVAEGIVHRRQGAGSFVARPSLHRRAGQLLSFSESAAVEGLKSAQSLISIGKASDALIREFQCEGPAVYLRRVRYLDGLPCAVHSSIIPQWVARDMEALSETGVAKLQSPGFSLYEAFEEAGFNVREARERVTTRLAGPEECSLLNIRGPASVMVVFRRSYDGSGRLVEAVEAVYHGEFYTYDMRLVSAAGGLPSRVDQNVLSLGGQVVRPKKTGSSKHA